MAILQASNLTLTEGQEATTITATVTASDGTLTVKDISGFAVAQYLLLGDWGDEQAEIVQIHASTAPSGTTITLDASEEPAYAHGIDTKVTALNFNQIEFFRATTSGGTKTSLISDTPQDLNADNQYSSYNDTTNSTGYWYFQFYNETTAVTSSYSGEFLYAGLAANSVRKMKENALGMAKEEISDLITDQFLLDELNNWQREIQRMRNWSWELTSTTDTTVSGQSAYAVPTDLKHNHEGRDIIQMRIKNYAPLQHIDKREWDDKMVDWIYTTLAADVATDDTEITLTDSSDFPSTGVVIIGSDSITYTANDEDTNILTVTTSTISTTHSTGDTVWYQNQLGKPEYWSLYEDYFYLYPVVSSDEADFSITIDHYKELTAFDDDTDTTEIPFYNIAQYYLAWKIEERKGDSTKAERWRQIYENRLAAELKRDPSGFYPRFTLSRPKGVGY